MRFSLHHCKTREARTTRVLSRSGMRANTADMDRGNRTPEGAVQS